MTATATIDITGPAPPAATPPSILPLVVEDMSFAIDGRRLIDGVSLTLEAGPRTVILGPNGAGKSLLLRLCHGLLTPTGGRVTWHGAGAADTRQHQAMVFQKPVLLRRSARANVDYALKLKKIARDRRRAITDDVMARTGLAAVAETPARLLSGGEQQKLALARAWALKPQVLFLDEPTSHLDPAATAAVEAIVEDMRGDGTRIVMTTHDLGQARRMADHVAFLHKGRLLETTPAESFFERPKSGEAAAFLRGELRW